jgi:glycosyl transferase family 25
MIPSVPIFIISLPQETERRSWMQAQMDRLGLPFTWFDATDGRQTDVLSHPIYNKLKRRLFFGTDLKGGELGCLLSHKAAYQKLVDENLSMAVILEDDCVLGDDFPKVLQALEHHTDKFDIIRFLGSPKVMKRGGRKVFNIIDEYFAVRMPTAPGGAHATLLTKSGAEKILKHLNKTAFPIDTLLGRTWETGANVLGVMPGLATQNIDDFESAIGDEREIKAADLEGWQKAVYPITRAYHKISESIGKKWTYAVTKNKDEKMRLDT